MPKEDNDKAAEGLFPLNTLGKILERNLKKRFQGIPTSIDPPHYMDDIIKSWKDKENMPKEDNDKAAEGLFPQRSPFRVIRKSNDPPTRARLGSKSASWEREPVYPSEFKFAKCKEGAVVPSKAHPLDSGFDLTIIDIVKDYGKTKLYGTGIKIQPPEGIYFDMVARSSISKTGYILTNSVGVIDNQYRGELLIALTKIDDSKPDLELPVRIAQLIPRQWLDIVPIEIAEENLTHKERGEEGWGSTGN